MDWVRISRSTPGLNGAGGKVRRDIPMFEVAQHNKQDDAWMVLGGKVNRRLGTCGVLNTDC